MNEQDLAKLVQETRAAQKEHDKIDGTVYSVRKQEARRKKEELEKKLDKALGQFLYPPTTLFPAGPDVTEAELEEWNRIANALDRGLLLVSNGRSFNLHRFLQEKVSRVFYIKKREGVE